MDSCGFKVVCGRGQISHDSMNQFYPVFITLIKKWQEANFSAHRVVSDSSYCPRVVSFHIVSAQGLLQLCFGRVCVLRATSYLSCLWPSVGGVAEFIQPTRKCILFRY